MSGNQNSGRHKGPQQDKPDAPCCKWCGNYIHEGDYCTPDKKPCEAQAAMYKEHVKGGSYE